jgi:hypothetical protein
MRDLELDDLPTLEGLEEILLNLDAGQINSLNDFYGTGFRDLWRIGGPEIDVRIDYEKAIARQENQQNFLAAKIFGPRLSSNQRDRVKKIKKVAAYVANLRHVEAGADGALEHVAAAMATAILAREAGVEVSRTDLAMLLNAWLACDLPLG